MTYRQHMTTSAMIIWVRGKSRLGIGGAAVGGRGSAPKPEEQNPRRSFENAQVDQRSQRNYGIMTAIGIGQDGTGLSTANGGHFSFAQAIPVGT